ncbi:MAG: cell division protein FtsA [Spirosomataceae bacterium]
MKGYNEIVVGLDIGSSKVRAVAGSLTEEGYIKIEGFEEESFTLMDSGVFNGQIVNVPNCTRLIDSVLQTLADRCNSDIDTININISGTAVSTQEHQGVVTASGENITIQSQDVDKLIQHIQMSFQVKEGHVIVHTLPLDFRVNNTPAENPVGRVGVQLSGNYQVVTHSRSELETLNSTIQRINSKVEDLRMVRPLRIDMMVLGSMAEAFSLLTPSDRRNGVAVAHMGQDLTEITVFYRGGLRFRSVLPIAGRTITNDLAEAFKIQPEEAEKLKVVYSLLLSLGELQTEGELVVDGVDGLPPKRVSVKQIQEVVEVRLLELAYLVSKELEKSDFKDMLNHGLVLSGGTSNMYRILPVFEEVLGKAFLVRKADPLRFVKTDVNDVSLRNIKNATAIGLMLASLQPFDQRFPDNRTLLSPQRSRDVSSVVKKPNVNEESKPNKEQQSLINRIKNTIGLGGKDLNDLY